MYVVWGHITSKEHYLEILCETVSQLVHCILIAIYTNVCDHSISVFLPHMYDGSFMELKWSSFSYFR